MTTPTQSLSSAAEALVVILDAIVANPRSRFLDDIALARAAKSIIATHRALAKLDAMTADDARRNFEMIIGKAAAAIVGRDYEGAYQCFDELLRHAASYARGNGPALGGSRRTDPQAPRPRPRRPRFGQSPPQDNRRSAQPAGRCNPQRHVRGGGHGAPPDRCSGMADACPPL